MAKYIDAEKLIAEIKRQKHELELSIQSQGDYGQSCHIVAYDNILSLIDSLQQEPQEVDLEKELYKHFGQVNDFTLGMRIGKYFYELGRKQVLQEIYDGKTKPVDKITAAWLDDKEEDK